MVRRQTAALAAPVDQAELADEILGEYAGLAAVLLHSLAALAPVVSLDDLLDLIYPRASAAGGRILEDVHRGNGRGTTNGGYVASSALVRDQVATHAARVGQTELADEIPGEYAVLGAVLPAREPAPPGTGGCGGRTMGTVATPPPRANPLIFV